MPVENEKPVIEEPAAKEPAGEDVRTEAASLMEELNRLGVSNAEQLTNMATASRESGRLANMVGELRREIDQLRTDKRRPRQATETYDNPYETEQYGNQDIAGAVREGIRSVLREHQEISARQQQAVWDEYAQITSDPDYNTVKEVWEAHMRSPDVQYRINTGQTSPAREYDGMVRRYYRKIAERSRDVLSKIGTIEKSTPPHVEAGNPSGVQREIPPDDKRERLRQIEKNRHGNDDDIDAMLDAILPSGDLASLR